MNVRLLAWLLCIVPIAAAHGAHAISAAQGQVPWCFPYLEGCTSISAAARHGLANPVFRAVMMPMAMLLALFWWLAYAWLKALPGAARRRGRAMLVLGMAGAAFLVLYTTFLGVEGSIYQWLRRYGVVFHFAFTVLAQMLLTSAVAGEARVPRALQNLMIGFCWSLLLLGLASIPLQNLVANADAAADAIEWCFALLMSLFFPLVARAWAHTGFTLRVELRSA